MLGFVAGVGHLPANTIISISLSKTPPQSPVGRSIQSQKVRPICPVCQLVAYMSRPEAKIADKDHTVKGPQRFILMDRSWGFLYQCAATKRNTS